MCLSHKLYIILLTCKTWSLTNIALTYPPVTNCSLTNMFHLKISSLEWTKSKVVFIIMHLINVTCQLYSTYIQLSHCNLHWAISYQCSQNINIENMTTETKKDIHVEYYSNKHYTIVVIVTNWLGYFIVSQVVYILNWNSIWIFFVLCL